MSLRPYQQDAVDGIRAHYRKGTKRVLLHLATGGGKTVVFSYILKALVDRGKRGLMVVHGRHLVDQAAARLEREGVPHGVIMAGRETALGKPVYVCSIDTLRARDLYPPADLIVIDEAHMATSPSYKAFLERYRDAFILPVTATPYTTRSMRHMADAIVAPITVRALIDTGFLVPPRYVVPVTHDLSSVAVDKSSGDYKVDELAQFMGRSQVVGDLVANWQKFAEARPTLCFAPTIENSLAFVERCRSAGIPAAHVEANTPDDERRRVLRELAQGQLKIVSNVGILCTGVDLPFVSCLLLYRPTKSLNLYIQQCGRGTRPAPGKRDFVLIDHANNVREHGFIDDEHEVFLDGMPKAKKSGEAPVKVCPECFAANRLGESLCVRCEYQFAPEKNRAPDHVDGELREVTVDDFELKVRAFLKEKRRIQKARGYKRGWLFFQLKSEFGEETANRFMPKREIPSWVQRKRTASS